MGRKTYFILIISILVWSEMHASNIYVDQTLSSNITNGSYSIVSRNSSGSDGRAYRTIQAAINAASPGDIIYMRSGTYDCSRTGEDEISIAGKNGTSWNEGEYYTLTSYPGEWAVLDGKRNTSNGVVLHGGFPCYGSDVRSHYWKFERFEVKGGGFTSGDSTCSGIWLNVGPFIFRYLYIHDNLSYTYGDNPAGLSGTEMQDSLIEYCFFENNGSDGSTSHNCSNICFYSEVGDKIPTAERGYSPSRGGTKNNTVRYCYFRGGTIGGAVGIKHKIDQYFSGRNPDGGEGWDDTYRNYGDKYHNNIFDSLGRESVYVCQDFAQVFQNLFIKPSSPAVCVQYAPLPQFYKVCIYNNTFIEPESIAIVRYGSKGYFSFNEEINHYGWDCNNLIEGGSGSSPWGVQEIISVIPFSTGVRNPILTHYVSSNNYFFSPNSNNVYRLYNSSYNPSEYPSQINTSAPRIVYVTNSSFPFVSNTGYDRYRPIGSFVLRGSTTIANGGIGGSHPYLTGVAIPSYIGAVDPNNGSWVGLVLGLSSTINLKAGDSDIDFDIAPPNPPKGVVIQVE